jgi:hypothetical protein
MDAYAVTFFGTACFGCPSVFQGDFEFYFFTRLFIGTDDFHEQLLQVNFCRLDVLRALTGGETVCRRLGQFAHQRPSKKRSFDLKDKAFFREYLRTSSYQVIDLHTLFPGL